MGCDIHAICEVKENGVWKINPEPVFKNPYYREGEESDWDWAKDPMVSMPRIGRNYDLFGVLANVRNGCGFAGIKTGNGFHVIAMPKGLPEDLSEEGKVFFGIRIDDVIGASENPYDENDNYYVTKEKAAEWVRKHSAKMLSENIVSNIDYHSDSHLSVEEFVNFDWTGNYTEKVGLITLEQYQGIKETGEAPKQWYGGVGRNTLTLSPEQADKFLSSNSTLPIVEGTSVYVEYKWVVNYKEWFNHFLEEFLKPMCDLRTRYEDVRLVISFDN